MHHLEQRVARGKREELADYCVRVIAHHCTSDIPVVREDMIGEALRFYRDRVVEHVEEKERATAISDRRHLEARLAETAKDRDRYKAAYTNLRDNTPTSIPIREAEAGCLKSFNRAREKAAMLFEDEGGQPTASSEAIRAIPDPKPRWSK
ncbi:hypothetical protein [Agrobacterium vaccinii]|uniref:hypothetical protein n=1 Tax=Agrobacterium vaccinii TaxID=2735528 RepID=UPI001E5A953D|nr:hypothetical protein [Agrobacterium vaccinii]UHS56848.1 hypothetical protein HRS00_08555 [Agrobacterium vaccinii]